MWSVKSCITLALLSCVVMSVVAHKRNSDKEKDAITTSLNHQIQLFDRLDVEGWKSDLSPDAEIEGLSEKYSVAELGRYFEKLGATKLKSKITAPFSISDNHAVFARTIRGSTKDGCTFSQNNVVTLVRFNEQMKVVHWHDMWQEIESIKVCPKDEL